MKKITAILAALAAAFAVSCTKEAAETQIPQDQNVPAGMKMVTITASIEGADTKTSYDAAGKFSWTKGDKISVFASDKKFYEFVANETASTSSFTGYIPEGISLRNDYAFFPADPGHRRDGDNYYYTIPEYKDLSSAFSADIPMGAFMSDGVYKFNHITGAALFTFTNIPQGVETVKITFTHSVKLSGEWGIYHSKTDEGAKCWAIGAFGANTESEGTFSRKVSVKDNEAKVYLPYPPGSTIWSGLKISVVGYDNSGNELILLKDQKTRQDITLPRAHVIPISPLTLPDYVPEVDWSKVEWDGENVATAVVDPSAQYSKVKELKVSSDDYYMYVRLNMSMEDPFLGDYIDIFLSDGNGSTSAWWGWATKGTNVYAPGLGSHKGSIDVTSGQLTKMKFILPGEVETTVDVHTEVAGEDIYWYMAYPCDYIEPYVNQDGKVYVSFMLWKSWTPYGVIPTVNSNMLEVTLP